MGKLLINIPIYRKRLLQFIIYALVSIIWTPNTIIANPDFEIWRVDVDDEFLFSQFQGREHLNVASRLRLLNEGDKKNYMAFNHHVFGISSAINKSVPSLMAALDYDRDLSEYLFHINSLKEGLDMFESTFGFKSDSFIAPNFIWYSKIEGELKNYGVNFLQGGFYQYMPDLKNFSYQKKFHYNGEKNQHNQIYLTRNCKFELSKFSNRNWVNCCLNNIETAFFSIQPAIICAQRVNFMGKIDEKNLKNNLENLDSLISKTLQKHPDAIFKNTCQLGGGYE